ncbi:hypothetical protein [Pseudomonas sp. NPDC087615]|uniref:hypothetical protein n=1 Tax=Pseudomonas sp. NPDC087615 TaxID=3364443 RepID=UPI003802011D
MDEKLDPLRLLWIGTPGAGTSEDLEKPADASGTVTIHLPASVVGANIRRTVSVKYAVQRHNLWTQSDELPLNVLDFQDPDKDLPRPEVPQADNGVLDLMEFIGDADVLVEPWPFIAKGQFASISLEGSTSTGNYIIEVLKNHPITDQQALYGLEETLLKSELVKLLHSSPATVKCKVIFDGSTDEAVAIELPKLPLIIRTRYDYVTPVITKVLDPRGKEIPEAGFTYDKRVTFRGTATRGEKVEVKINDVPKGTPDTDAMWSWECPADSLTEGLHTITIKALYDADEPIGKPRTFTVGIATKPSITEMSDSKGPVPHSGSTYSIKAQALYGDHLESPARTFTVKAHILPTLTSVRHSGGELGEGLITYDASVTLTGEVTPRYDVQVYDNKNQKPIIVSANERGTWTTSLPIDAGRHEVYVKALATDQQSNSRSFTREIVPPLFIDPSHAVLSGYLVRHTNRPVTHPHPGTHLTRTAKGGVLPYSFSTDTPSRIQVDAISGEVIGIRNGVGKVIVTDARGSTASYPITIQNVWYIASYGATLYDWATMEATANNAGGKIPAIADYYNMRDAYHGDPGQYPNDFHWTNDRHAWGAPWLIRPSDGVVYGSNDNGKVACIGVLMST